MRQCHVERVNRPRLLAHDPCQASNELERSQHQRNISLRMRHEMLHWRWALECDVRDCVGRVCQVHWRIDPFSMTRSGCRCHAERVNPPRLLVHDPCQAPNELERSQRQRNIALRMRHEMLHWRWLLECDVRDCVGRACQAHWPIDPFSMTRSGCRCHVERVNRPRLLVHDPCQAPNELERSQHQRNISLRMRHEMLHWRCAVNGSNRYLVRRRQQTHARDSHRRADASEASAVASNQN